MKCCEVLYGLNWPCFYDTYRRLKCRKNSSGGNEETPEDPEKRIQLDNEIWYTTSNKEVIAKFSGDPNEFDATYQTDYDSFDHENPMVLESHVYESEGYGVATFDRDVTFMPIFNVGDEYLEAVYVPKTVKYIHPAAFMGLNLSGVYFYSEIPPTLYNGYDIEERDVFMFDIYDGEGEPINATYPIYVPKDLLDTYKGAFGWSKYAERIKPIE